MGGNVHFDLKLVSVKLVGLGRALPTFSFGFLKSFFLSLFFFALDPIVTQDGRGSRSGRWLYAVAVAVDRVVQKWFDMQENMLNCVACESLIFHELVGPRGLFWLKTSLLSRVL